MPQSVRSPADAASSAAATASNSPAPVGTVFLSLARPVRGGPRALVVRDTNVARRLGEVVLGHLFLDDERHFATTSCPRPFGVPDAGTDPESLSRRADCAKCGCWAHAS